MKIEGRQTTLVEVDVSPSYFIKTLEKLWKKDIGINSDWYINSKGFWEEWEDTHASGFSIQHRQATAEEVEMEKSFKKVFEFGRKEEKR